MRTSSTATQTTNNSPRPTRHNWLQNPKSHKSLKSVNSLQPCPIISKIFHQYEGTSRFCLLIKKVFQSNDGHPVSELGPCTVRFKLNTFEHVQDAGALYRASLTVSSRLGLGHCTDSTEGVPRLAFCTGEVAGVMALYWEAGTRLCTGTWL